MSDKDPSVEAAAFLKYANGQPQQPRQKPRVGDINPELLRDDDDEIPTQRGSQTPPDIPTQLSQQA